LAVTAHSPNFLSVSYCFLVSSPQKQRQQSSRSVEVAKSAATELTAHIESIRQEAYNEGYAAAMRAVVEFSASGTAKSKVTVTKATSAKSTTATTAAPRRQRRAPTKPAARQIRRGDNAIAEAMMTLPEQTGPAAEIKRALAKKGRNLPYTSIRHGLGQLQTRGEASVAEDGRTWRYSPPQQQ
jgi:hypothetical protein